MRDTPRRIALLAHVLSHDIFALASVWLSAVVVGSGIVLRDILPGMY